MADVKFALGSIGKIDNGKVELAINKAITQVVDDMQQRPGDKSKRVVSVDIEFTPEADQDGTLVVTGSPG